MAKVITFSTRFPAYHPKAGQPTNFPEKLWKALSETEAETNLFDFAITAKLIGTKLPFGEFQPKYHTIRAGNRWKVGDKFSPRVWSGKPYNSKQITIGPNIEIVNVWEIESTGNNYLYLNGRSINLFEIQLLAKNDGLNYKDLMDWFKYPKPFKGQVICWSKKVNY